MTIEIKVETLPTEWIPASAARENAISIRNEVLAGLMNNLMEIIESKSLDGRLGATIEVGGGRPTAVYENAQAILKALGYTVDGDCTESNKNRFWRIGW